MDSASSAAPLFEPFSYKTLHLPNRIVMAPMTRVRSPSGVPGPDMSDYYRRRAEGGVGLIITEGTTIGRPAASFDANIPNIHNPDSIAAWRDIVDEVHTAGAKIASQLWHVGLSSNPAAAPPPNPEALPEGPSSNRPEHTEMTSQDIDDTIDAFADAAATAQQVGFDAIELHGAHGYLIDQFLWDQSNHRSDRYGGATSDRTTFAQEIVRAVRARVGADYVVILRLSQWKVHDYTAKIAPTPGDLEALLGPISDAGVDIFDMSTRRFWKPEFPGSDLNLAGWTKKLTGKPTVTVGSISVNGAFDGAFNDHTQLGGKPVDLANLYERLAREEFDLVAVGRALITNPDWARKVRAGKIHELTTTYNGAFDRLSDAEIAAILNSTDS
jgi:2,4-dienoyl-CoA reductase-like NADH-dependent reductase (Old Yellow Enzyme family)